MRQFSRISRVSALAVSVSALFVRRLPRAGDRNLVRRRFPPSPPRRMSATTTSASPRTHRLSTSAGNNAGAGFTTSGISGRFVLRRFHRPARQHDHCTARPAAEASARNSLNGGAQDSSPRQRPVQGLQHLAEAGLAGAPTDTPDYVGTDAPYSTADYNAFPTMHAVRHPHRRGVQIPGPRRRDRAAAQRQRRQRLLLEQPAGLCKIFSGLLTRWTMPGVIWCR